LPPKIKKHPEVMALLERRKAIETQQRRIRASLEESMRRGDQFLAFEIRRLLGMPTLAPMLEQLAWIGDGVIGYLVEGGRALIDAHRLRHRIEDSVRLRIAHPYDLFQTGELLAWQRECFRAERIQPFKQVFRELYLLTENESEEGVKSRRYAGHQVRPKQAVALLNARGWVARPEEGIQRVFHDSDVMAVLEFDGGYLTPAEVEYLSMGTVCFMRPQGDWTRLPLAEIPPRIFSEVMRDLDLVVSVAHAGGVDPETTASTMEMRASLLKETLSLMNIHNVRLEGRHVFIDGKLGNYSVHLGSAVVHRQPGGSVCIVPVHGQHRGRLFLPFVDDDPRSAEVVSKVLLLARDDKIRDPSILEQLVGN
jgi:hypothetical protein